MVGATEALSASLENYLEAIWLLVREHTVARSKDIARRLKVNRSSVTGALQALRDRGLVNYEPYGYVTLTEEGSSAAQRVLRRHETLRDFFVRVLSIDEAEADEAACRMEHGISKPIVDRLLEFAAFVETCPRAGPRWIRGFGYRCQEAAAPSSDACRTCMAQCLADWEKTKKAGSASSMSTTLDTIKPGEKGIIEKISGTGPIKRRIRDMGVTTGSLVEVVRIAPLGDPMDVKIKGYHLSLRKEEARDIRVARIEPTGEKQ